MLALHHARLYQTHSGAGGETASWVPRDVHSSLCLRYFVNRGTHGKQASPGAKPVCVPSKSTSRRLLLGVGLSNVRRRVRHDENVAASADPSLAVGKPIWHGQVRIDMFAYRHVADRVAPIDEALLRLGVERLQPRRHIG